MKDMKKILIYSITAVAVFGICGIGIASVKAEGSGLDYPPVLQKLVERFNLNADEVKEVFDEMRQERQVRFGERPVFQDLTDEQKESLAAKREEMKEEMESWAEANGIDSKYMMGFGFKRFPCSSE